MPDSPNLADDLEFLRAHTPVVSLEGPGGSIVAVAPELQGRVMTSGHPGGPGYGWVNRALVASGGPVPHIHAYGGEDRLWLGPEGGQFSIFFAPGAPFEFEHWQTPAVLDSEPFELVSSGALEVSLRASASLVNWSGTRLEVALGRTVRTLRDDEAALRLGFRPEPGTWVGFESANELRNGGPEAWTPAGGLLSLWVLGMFRPGERAVVVVPLRPGGPGRVASGYFGAVGSERLALGPGHAFFRADGRYRSKIGVGPEFAVPRAGSWDAGAGAFTLVEFDMPPAPHGYVNSLWEHQADPFGGDVVNSYNDGPPAPGVAPLGPFYELESSSPALALPPGGAAVHRHCTIHVAGPGAAEAMERSLGVGPEEALAALGL